MADSARKKILEAALKALLAVSETAWWLKGPATLIAELAPIFGNLPDDRQTALSKATPKELTEALLRLESATEFREAVASGIVRVENFAKALRDDVAKQSSDAAAFRAFAESFAGGLEDLQSTMRRVDETTTEIAADVKHIKAKIDAGRDELQEKFDREEQLDDLFPVFGVPFHRNQYFTGRSDVLSNLRQLLIKGGKAALGQAISGLGGIGKTQTAVEYTYQHREEYQAILWVKADTELAIKSSYVEIAKLLRLPFEPAKPDDTVQTVRLWFERNSDWLLVFDNADHAELLKPFLPRTTTGHVLLTSRAAVLDALGIKSSLELQRMPTEEGVQFLLGRTNRAGTASSDRAAAEQLAHELDGLPLALEQAGAYIRATSVDFQCYLENYRERRLELLEKPKAVTGEYPATVATTWRVNFSEVEKESRDSADLLRFSAFLGPDAIPFELVTEGASQCGLAGGNETSLALYETLEPLHRFSLIQIDANDESYSIHRLVQEVLKDAMDAEARQAWAERIVQAVDAAFPSAEYANWQLCKRLLPHALAAKELIACYHLESEESAHLLYQTGGYLYERGEYAEAEPLLSQAVEIARAALDEGHPHHATFLNGLSTLFVTTGRFAEAEPLLKRAIEIQRSQSGEEDRAFATLLVNLAGLYHAVGRYAEAEPLLKRAIEIQREAIGEDDPDFANSLNALALLHQLTGQYADAERLLIRSMEIRRATLGDRHPRFISSLNNLAMLYHDMGRYAEAEPLLKQAMENRRVTFGENSPRFALSLNNLAMLYQSTDRNDEAEPLLMKALEIARDTIGEHHPNFAASLNNLAMHYKAMGRHSEAEPLLKQAMQILRNALGENHPRSHAILSNLAGLYESRQGHSGRIS